MTEQDRKTVVVTGASGGVGRAVARAYARRGANVALLARGGAGLDGAAAEVARLGGTALPIEVDVADHKEVFAAADQVERQLGPIDIWVNVAMASVFAPFEQLSPEEFERATKVTYLGYVYGTMAALRRMRPRNRGTVVQVGSALAYRGIPLQSAYCGAKHAIQGFNESVRCELLHERSRVRTTMVQLPAVNTPQFSWVLSRLGKHPRPVPPIYQPEVAARAILFAGDHPRRREYWVGGSTVKTLVGNALAPGMLDRYLARTGYASQQTDKVGEPGEAANLWAPADDRGGGDYGAHGVFGDEARRSSVQLWASHHHGTLTAAAVGLTALAAAAVWRSR